MQNMKKYEITHYFQETPKARRKRTKSVVEAYSQHHAKLVLDIWEGLIINIKEICN
jgi:hypothetical protein